MVSHNSDFTPVDEPEQPQSLPDFFLRKQPDLKARPVLASEIAKQVIDLPEPAKTDKQESIMKLLLTLNESVRALGSRFDTHQRFVEERFDKINAELTLLKNRVDIMEASFRQQKAENSKPTDSF